MLAKPRYLRIWKTAILPFVDFIFIFFGIVGVYLIRYKWLDENFLGVRKINTIDFVYFAISVALSIVLIYATMGLYIMSSKRGLWTTLSRQTIGILVVVLGLITYFFFNEYNTEAFPQGIPISRFILGTGGFVALGCVFLGRSTVWIAEKILNYFKIGKISVAIVGNSDEKILNKIRRMSGYADIKIFPNLDVSILPTLKTMLTNGEINEVYLLSDPNHLGSEIAQIAELHKINFIFAPESLSDYKSFGLNPITIDNRLLLEIKHTPLDGWQIVAKRVFDIAFSLTFLILFSWLYLIIAIAIWIESPGPIFYKSERIGPNKKVFKLWKFRRLKLEFCTSESNPDTLAIEQELIAKMDARKDGVLYKIANDPRSTKVGNFLEKYSLDELPQFFNVLIGNMSLVGPRPHQPREVAKYSNHHFKVLNISPGLTGFAQINGRSDLKFEDEVKFDVFYIEHWNFWFDLWIIIKTPFVVLFKRHT